MFRPLAPLTVRWQPAVGTGMEHCSIEPAPGGGALVRSVVVGTFDGVPYGAHYRIEIDRDWRVETFTVEATAGRRLALASPEPGRWIDTATGAPRPDLDGCIDIDLSASPFTNTLPIRRLGLRSAAGEVALRMAYVPFDTLTPFADLQHYRAIEDGTLYRFENDDRSFAADLAVDRDGIVTDYPHLYKRL